MVTILLRGDPATDPAFFSSFAFYQLYTEQISSLTYSGPNIRGAHLRQIRIFVNLLHLAEMSQLTRVVTFWLKYRD